MKRNRHRAMNRTMTRREFGRLLGLAGMGALAPLSTLGSSAAVAAAPYTGPFYISLAAVGGWDVTSFCDPKTNVLGERSINSWADSAEIEQVGNIRYAPVAKNREFFERFYQDMLVINGIDSQTNSHDDGQRHTWSGRLSFGYPSFGALMSASLGPELALSLVHDSGYSETAGITRFSRLQNPEVIRNLVYDAEISADSQTFGLVDSTELSMIEQAHAERLQRQLAQQGLLPRQRQGLNNLQLANDSRGGLATFGDLLPSEFEQDSDFRAAELALLAYQSGLCISAQLGFNGFDTHQNHDEDHPLELEKLTDLISFIFDKAEEAGFADRIVMTVGSDFGRTPYYNSGGGKDHWPIGSALFIQQGASWGNRVVGATDEGHNALNIDPMSLAEDPKGLRLEPKHIQQAMRELGGIASNSFSGLFPLYAESVNFFG